MRRNPISLGVLAFFLVIIGLLIWVVWIGFLTGRAVDGQESGIDSDEGVLLSNSSGFIGLCNEEECMTMPTQIEREGEKWMLGFYPEYYGNTGKPVLTYRSKDGKFMALSEAFAVE